MIKKRTRVLTTLIELTNEAKTIEANGKKWHQVLKIAPISLYSRKLHNCFRSIIHLSCQPMESRRTDGVANVAIDLL